MSTYIWFVPGFMGSALSAYRQQAGAPPPGAKTLDLFGTRAALHAGDNVNLLALGASLPAGVTIHASGLTAIAGDGYERFGLYLVSNIPLDWTYAPWAYDWRQSAADLGAALASQLIANKARGADNIVVAHSFGALVAWAAWAALVDAGQQVAMQRLITFGGALYGSESAPGIFRGDERAIDALALWLSFIGTPLLGAGAGAAAFFGHGARLQSVQVGRLLSIARTWRGLYDLYPDVSQLDDPDDKYRNLLYDPTAWATAQVAPDFVLLGAEVMNVHQHLRQPKYAMPPGQVAHIVCETQNTPSKVHPAELTAQQAAQLAGAAIPRPSDAQLRRRTLPGFTIAKDGDGRCTTAQQMFPGGYYQTVSSQHAAMPSDRAVQQLVVRLLTMPLPTRPPTPPLQQETVWHPPPALPDAPQFLFNNDPTFTAQPVKIPFKDQINEGLPALQ